MRYLLLSVLVVCMIGVMVPSVFAEAPPPFERTIITLDGLFPNAKCPSSDEGPPTFALSNDNSILIPSTHGVICKISPNGDFTLLDFTNVLDFSLSGAFHLDSNDNLFFAPGGWYPDCQNCVYKFTLDGLLLLSFPAEDNLGNPIGFTGFLESIEEITTDPAGNIYVLRNHPHHDPVGFSIFKYNRAGIYVDQITLPPSIHAVSNITFDSLGNFYFIAAPSWHHGPLLSFEDQGTDRSDERWENVPDIDTFQLNKMSPDGNVTTLIESEPLPETSSTTVLVCVNDIEIDSIGNIYLATCHRHIDISTSKFDSNGVLLFGFESNPKSEYQNITGIEIGSDGKLYALQRPMNHGIAKTNYSEWNIHLFRAPTINLSWASLTITSSDGGTTIIAGETSAHFEATMMWEGGDPPPGYLNNLYVIGRIIYPDDITEKDMWGQSVAGTVKNSNGFAPTYFHTGSATLIWDAPLRGCPMKNVFSEPSCPAGQYTVTFTLDTSEVFDETDETDNTIVGTFTVVSPEVPPDAPTVNVPDDIVVETAYDMAQEITFVVTATDDVGVTSGPICQYRDARASMYNLDPSSFPDGQIVIERYHSDETITIVCTASDADGNTGTGTFTVNVVKKSDQIIQPTLDESANVESTVPSQQSNDGGCLIATAAFGSEMAPQVQFLRELRDNTVLQTESGTSFMAGFNQFYYSFSPAVADYERENPVFKEAVKLTLTPLLTSLTLLQYTNIDSESEMLGYGIGVILLNIGMYFVAPAVVIMAVRKIR